MHSKISLISFTRQNGLVIEHMGYAKKISAALLEQKPVRLYSDFPITGNIPEGLFLCHEEKGVLPDGRDVPGIAVTLRETVKPWPLTLRLYPRIVAVGIGCRKNMPAEQIERKVLEALGKQRIPICCLFQAASVDLKREEEGILEFCRKYSIPYRTFSGEELKQAKGDFSSSEFVASIAGVDNVCERAAVLAAEQGTLTGKKYAGGGVTVALAVKKWSVRFE